MEKEITENNNYNEQIKEKDRMIEYLIQDKKRLEEQTKKLQFDAVENILLLSNYGLYKIKQSSSSRFRIYNTYLDAECIAGDIEELKAILESIIRRT